MIYKNISLNKNLIYYEKLNNLYMYNKNNVIINKLIITLKIPSNIKFNYGFLTMLTLLEKNTNNLPIFLKDINTLSKKRSIKIGLTILLKTELMEKYIQLCMYHSMPKISDNNIIFKIAIKNYNLFYNTNIILSNTIFSFDADIFQYYTYINGLSYYLEFSFSTNIKNILVNKLVIDQYNLNFVIDDTNIIDTIVETTEHNIMLELGDELNKSDDEIDDSVEENIKENYNNIIIKNKLYNVGDKYKNKPFLLNYIIYDIQ
jgi:hypothetical protein